MRAFDQPGGLPDHTDLATAESIVVAIVGISKVDVAPLSRWPTLAASSCMAVTVSPTLPEVIMAAVDGADSVTAAANVSASARIALLRTTPLIASSDAGSVPLG